MADLAVKYDESPKKRQPKKANPQESNKLTYKDYKNLELEPNERCELIDGVIYMMAAPNTEHQRISMYLSAKLYNYLEGKTCQVFAAPFDVRLFYKEDESDTTVVQPDLIVVCDPKKLGYEGAHYAPDLVIEILSPSNTAEERSRKLDIYMRAKAPEIWLIDPKGKCVSIYRLRKGHYVLSIQRMGEILKTPKFPGLEIPLDNLFSNQL